MWKKKSDSDVRGCNVVFFTLLSLVVMKLQCDECECECECNNWEFEASNCVVSTHDTDKQFWKVVYDWANFLLHFVGS